MISYRGNPPSRAIKPKPESLLGPSPLEPVKLRPMLEHRPKPNQVRRTVLARWGKDIDAGKQRGGTPRSQHVYGSREKRKSSTEGNRKDPKLEKQVFELRNEGYTVLQIALGLHVSKGTVSGLLHRERQRARETA